MNANISFLNRYFLLAGLAVMLITSACKREYDSPPERELPVGQVISIQELRNLYVNEPVRFEEDYSVYATVTADETSGNLYRNIYVQDDSAAINLRLQNPGGLYEGDRIRIYLPGTVLSKYQGMMQLDSVDVDNNIIKQETNVHVEPKLVTIPEITPELQGHLIRLTEVEFATSALCDTYSDPVGQTNQNRMLTDCDGNQVIVRTSGYANFAGTPIPEGNGSFVAVVGQFGGDMQLFIRDINEIGLNGERCTPGNDCGGSGACNYDVEPVDMVEEDFSSITSDNVDYYNPLWVNKAVQNNRVWRGRLFQGTKYLRATGFMGQGVPVPPTEIWLVTPPVIASEATALSFKAAQSNWSHDTDDPFKVFISTDFDGCDIEGATWTEITGFNEPTSSHGDYQFIASGAINLEGYLPQFYEGNYHIGFRYYSEGSQTTSIDLDDILIQ